MFLLSVAVQDHSEEIPVVLGEWPQSGHHSVNPFPIIIGQIIFRVPLRTIRRGRRAVRASRGVLVLCRQASLLSVCVSCGPAEAVVPAGLPFSFWLRSVIVHVHVHDADVALHT